MKPTLIVATLAAAITSTSFAGEVVTFDDGLPKAWKPTIGSWEAQDGVLVGKEVAEDNHAAASRYFVPITDGTVSFRFRLDTAKTISFGFDPARGQLKKKGHLYSAIVTPKAVLLKKHRDKARADSKDATLDRKQVDIAADAWVDVTMTLVGENATIKIGDTILTGSDPEFAVAKPGVVFRVSKGSAQFDDVSVTPVN